MVITVQCSACDTGFPVDPAKIPAGGVKVRCSACGSIFRVEPPRAEPEPEPTGASDDAQDAPAATTDAASSDPPPAVDGAPAPQAGAGSDWFQATDRAATPEPDTTGPAAAEFASDTASAGQPADWVFEREEDVDPDSLEINPVGTVEETVSAARDESSFFGGSTIGGGAAADAADDWDTTTADDDDAEAADDLPTFDLDEGDSLEFEAPGAQDEPDAATDEEPAAPPSAPDPAPVSGFTFGQRDPKEKAQRLARVLVSDMIMYNPERHERALANGTLRDDFEEEIAKSWKEYVDQVGEEMAEGNDFWTEALNDVLAKGQKVF